MRNVLLPLCAILLVSGMFVGAASAEENSDLNVPIVISPSTVNLDMKGVWVTVHAEIPYRIEDVVCTNVTLDGIDVKTTFADNRGDLVAKFIVGDVLDILNGHVGEEVELTLSGTAADGTPFSGKDTIRVIKPSSRK